MDSDRLSGAVAVISGASSGIGEATALRFADAGATVVLLARRVERLERLARAVDERGGHGIPVSADVTDPAAAATAIKRVVESAGRIDVLVAAAGWSHFVPTEEAELADWNRMVSVNVGGTLNCVHPALQPLLDAAAGPAGVADLVVISSVAGRIARGGNPVYSATKHAVNAFAEGIRQTYTARGVRVGIIEPGMVATEMTAESAPPGSEAHEWLQADDVADAVTYMVTRPRRMSVNELLVRPTEQQR